MASFPDTPEPVDDDLRSEYDFRAMRGLVRGKYADRSRIVTSAKDETKPAEEERP